MWISLRGNWDHFNKAMEELFIVFIPKLLFFQGAKLSKVALA
jgi:hypothetical protein